MRVRSALTCLLAATTVLTACTSDEDPQPDLTSAPPPIQVVELSFGVWGTEEEIAAFPGAGYANTSGDRKSVV